jgi:hypothetical protein
MAIRGGNGGGFITPVLPNWGIGGGHGKWMFNDCQLSTSQDIV